VVDPCPGPAFPDAGHQQPPSLKTHGGAVLTGEKCSGSSSSKKEEAAGGAMHRGRTAGCHPKDGQLGSPACQQQQEQKQQQHITSFLPASAPHGAATPCCLCELRTTEQKV